MKIKDIVRTVYAALDEKKAVDIKIIDISKVTVIADYFVIAGAENDRQVKTLADNVEEKLGKAKVSPRSIEGYQNANWVLMDYQDVIIHIFNQEQRLFYDLERIWTDGKLTEIDNL
ncbi:MAG: ribosome silencing factor [Lachnospiraceae bacterium]|jgi:ribosome-associated protein